MEDKQALLEAAALLTALEKGQHGQLINPLLAKEHVASLLNGRSFADPVVAALRNRHARLDVSRLAPSTMLNEASSDDDDDEQDSDLKDLLAAPPALPERPPTPPPALPEPEVAPPEAEAVEPDEQELLGAVDEKDEEPVPVPAVIPPRQPSPLPAAAAGNNQTQNLLEHHHALQSSLTSDLSSLARQLRTSTLAFSSSLETDKEALLSAQEKLEGNSEGLKGQQGRLGTLRSKSRGTTCATIGAVGAVAAAWIMMFLLLKVT